MTPVYLLPGLGADGRLFKRLQLPAGYELRLLEWPDCQGCSSLQEYAQRLLSRIDTSRPFLLGGVSLGGIISIELAKHISPAGLVLFSTAKTRAEFPGLFRWLDKTGLYRYFSAGMLRRLGSFANRFTPVSPEGRQLFLDMLYNTPDDLLTFFARETIKWKNTMVPAPFIHFHGNIDRVFPLKNIHEAIVISKGSHFMIFEKAAELNQLLQKHLPEFST